MHKQGGGLVLGLILGLLLGLALALAVALYVTKAPVPFVNKVPPRTADHDAAEAERNKNWDPNAGLVGKVPRPADAAASSAVAASGPAAPASAPVVPATAATPATTPAATAPAPSGRDPAAILAGGEVPAPKTGTKAPTLPPAVLAPPPAAAASAAAPSSRSAKSTAEPFIYFVQAGAFQSSDEAEQQRARLAMLGVETKLIEREQSGRPVFRVRAGPFNKQAEAEGVRDKLGAASVEALLVRVERPPQ